MTALVDDAPTYLRARISEPEWREEWLKQFRARLEAGKRDAVRLYPELLRMVGASEAMLEVALRAMGVTLEAAKLAVGAYRQVEGMDEAQIAAYGLETLRRYHEARGRRVLIVEAAEPGGAITAASEDPGPAMIPGSAAAAP